MTYEGYTGVEQHPDGKHLVVTRLTDFAVVGAPDASAIVTRTPYKGQAIQKFIVTPQQGVILHQGR